MSGIKNNDKDTAPLLSLCIPTYGVVEWVVPVIESIYSQGCDNGDFEVVITDNGMESKLGEAISRFDYPNLHYYRTTSQGFTNQIDAFRKCSGLFCKMINHRSRLVEGVLPKMLNLVDRYKGGKPILYFSDGMIKAPEITECGNVDEFCSCLSFFTSWSNGTGVWRQDIPHLDERKICYMFPHMVFLFYVRRQSEYVVWNEKFDIPASDKGKGGYDLIHTFAVTYLDEMHGLVEEGRLLNATFEKIRKDLLPFLSDWYRYEHLAAYTIHNFIIKDVRKSMSRYYSGREYCEFLLKAWQGLRPMYLYHASILHKSALRLAFDRFVLGRIQHDN